MYFDAHTHLQNIDKPYRKIVCASNLKEWEELAFKVDDITIPAYGIHPWEIEGADIAELEKFIKNNDCLLGECGLDRIKPHPDQYDIFIAQLEMARKYNKIIVIHCVKAWDIMVEALKNYNELTFLFHRFQGNKELIKQLPINSYFSFGARNLSKIADVPVDRVLLETDDDDNYSVAQVYEKSGVSIKQVANNARQLLGELFP